MDPPGGCTVSEDRWEHLIRHIQDAVVEFELIDEEPMVRKVNRSFVEVFGYDREELLGRPLNDAIVPDWLLEEARELDERTGSGRVNYQRVRRQTTDGLREFLYRGIPYDEPDSGTDGFAVYTDLTAINRQERQLQVLNRILRHNLRNKATVISGHTTRLLDACEEDTAEATRIAATVESAAYDLEHLADEAAQIKRVMDTEDDPDATTDCARIVRDLVGEHRQRCPGAQIDSDVPDTLTVSAGPQLSIAVDNLIENAVEHNPAETPTVRVGATVGEADGWAEVHVDDDGPEIPASEQKVVSGERAITQTEHGRGLGLWLVTWTVERFGGELLFEESDLGGNSVRLRLPRP